MISPFRFSQVSAGQAVLLSALVLAGCGSPEERAQNYYEQQDYVKASIELKNAVQLKKDMVAAWRGPAEIELHNKNYQGVFPILRTNNLASLIAEHHPEKANLDRAYSLAAILRKSQVPFFRDTPGWLDYFRGGYKSSTSFLEEAAAALPNRAIVQYHRT